MTLTRTFKVIAAMALGAAVSSAAVAGEGNVCADGAAKVAGLGEAVAKGGAAAEAAACLPEDVDLVIVVSRAASLRRMSAASIVARAVAEAGSLGDLGPAWAGLAQQLGWSQEETFDRLLGGRVVIATRSKEGGRSWAVISDVSEETERRLVERLRVAPRAIGCGHQILSIENGAYELTCHRAHVGGAGGGSPANSRRVILGPADRSDLFDDVLGALAVGAADAGNADGKGAKASAGLCQRPVFERARLLGNPDALVLAQLDEMPLPAGCEGEAAGAPAAKDPWSNFLVMGASQDPGSEPGRGAAWTARVISRRPARRAELERVPVSDDAPFTALSDGALLAVVQCVALSGVFGDDLSLVDLFRAMPLGAAKDDGIPLRQAICIRSAPTRDRLECTVCREVSDTAAAAAEMDGKIASFVGMLEKRFGSESPAPIDLGGVFPGAARVLPLTIAQPGPFMMVFKEPLMLAWAFPSAPGNVGDPVRGWCVLGVSQSREGDEPSATSLLRRECGAMCARGQLTKVDPGKGGEVAGRVGRWMWLGMARPAALEARIPPEIPDIRGFRSTMKRLDRVDARLSIGEGGEVIGDLKFRLSDDAVGVP